MENSGQLTTLDLFSGAGGISEGFREAGFRCLFANDFDQDAVDTFNLNHPGRPAVCEKVEDVDAREVRLGLGLAKGDLDCLAGGPPCTGFSINAPGRFLDDPRNKLFREYIRFVEEFEPKTVMLENVPGMLSLDGGEVFKQIVRSLESAGYDVATRILYAAHYGVPQERWRLIVLGSRLGSAPSHPVPAYDAEGRANFTGGRTLTYRLNPMGLELLPKVTVFDAIDDLPPLSAGEGADDMSYGRRKPKNDWARAMREGSARVRHHVAANLGEANMERLKHIPPGGSWRDIPFDLLPKGMQRARRSDHTRRYGRLTPESLASTVMTKMDPHWGAAFHYSQDRTLTVREAARLQSFPDRYVFCGSSVSQYKQVGNAVPVLLARAVAANIAAHIDASARGVQEFALCPS